MRAAAVGPKSIAHVMNQQCKVCGEPAAGFHFGAFTCEGCKKSKLHLSKGASFQSPTSDSGGRASTGCGQERQNTLKSGLWLMLRIRSH
ncbi:unnamed protein product [Bemisia tabaci]|uniref:Nuclear receptor domain-containing protein n=1 Tax=Bemisia tabaci TaxID=7038 RepID=A0A9P0A5H1_BEMTA|nr:unnamed protein product [Bemisia tabaci]